jgi:hypothetical protein
LIIKEGFIVVTRELRLSELAGMWFTIPTLPQVTDIAKNP